MLSQLYGLGGDHPYWSAKLVPTPGAHAGAHSRENWAGRSEAEAAAEHVRRESRCTAALRDASKSAPGLRVEESATVHRTASGVENNGTRATALCPQVMVAVNVEGAAHCCKVGTARAAL